MQTKIPKQLKETMVALVNQNKYPSLKAMCQVMLSRFLSEKPYQTRGFKWCQKNFFGDTDLVTFNVLVPTASKELIAQVRQTVAQTYPVVNMATFLASALVWWADQHNAKPPKLLAGKRKVKAKVNTYNNSPYLNYHALIGLLGRPGQENLPLPRVQVIEHFTSTRRLVRATMNGHQFTWGQIVERPADSLWMFDFYLEAVQKAFVSHGLSITDMQNRVFIELELRTSLTLWTQEVTRNMLEICGEGGFRIIPGATGKGMAFSVVCLSSAVQSARNWLVNEFLLREILTEVERAVLTGLDN
jgi:hypothetical protein